MLCACILVPPNSRRGVAKHVQSVFYEEYVEMEAMQPYAVRRDGNAVCLPDVIALPDGQLQ